MVDLISIESVEEVTEPDSVSHQESALESIQEALHGGAELQYEEFLQQLPSLLLCREAWLVSKVDQNEINGHICQFKFPYSSHETSCSRLLGHGIE